MENEMDTTEKSGLRAWCWAIVINLVVFVVLWAVLGKIPAPARSQETGPGGTFGQVTQLVDNPQPPLTTSTFDQPDIGASTASPDIGTVALPDGRWFGEFYLDRGPLLSFAPRLNSDGTPREHPVVEGRVKAPTYEDEETVFNNDDYYPPVMTPQFFSKLDLPEEYRDLEFNMTVKVHIDARGRVLGVPQIIKGSGHMRVDEIVVNKMMHEVTFSPATRKDTGEPVSVFANQPIFFE